MIYDDFKMPLSRQLDFPISPRSKGTKKVLLPDDCFAPFLSYLYGIAEWVWYMNHANPNRDSFIQKLTSHEKTIATNDSGFTPIFRCNDKYYPINEIPTKIAPALRPRKNQVCQLKSCTFIPHYIHLSIVMAETGIRLMSCRWFDEQTYDQYVNRETFIDDSYMNTKLWVNTDKSHDAWEADVSEIVIGILDRQSTWKATFLNGEDVPIYYDGHENSNFDMLQPLFAQVNPHLRITESFSPVTDGSYRKAFKFILVHFSYIYSKISCDHCAPIEINHELDLAGNLNRIKEFKGENAIEITPHSMRSEVVSEKITILPPSVIQRTTGHANEAHVLYYAQIKNKFLNTQKAAQDQEFRDFIAPMMIDTKSNQSAIKQALLVDGNSAINDFGAISFSDHSSKEPRSGLLIIKKKVSLRQHSST